MTALSPEARERLSLEILQRLAAWEEGDPPWYRGDPSLLDLWPDEFHAMREIAVEDIALRDALAAAERERDEAREQRDILASTAERVDDPFVTIDALRAQVATLREALQMSRSPQACDGSGHTTIFHFGESGDEEGCEEVACNGCCACCQTAVDAVLASTAPERAEEER